MSEREDFNAWLKTWALPGNTSREDAMYAAWQARAARIAPAEPAICPTCGEDEPFSGTCGTSKDDTKALCRRTTPDALQAEVSKNKLLRAQLETVRLQRDKELKEKCEALNDVERLREEVEGLKAESLEWAVSRWKAEVSSRPIHNVHRQGIDETWRQVIRRFGGDPETLCGPTHGEPVARTAKPEVNHE